MRSANGVRQLTAHNPFGCIGIEQAHLILTSDRSPGGQRQMRIAYFTNQYPATSHTFIRREIQAMEARGHEVFRYAVRCKPEDLVDPEDIREYEATHHVLALRKTRLIAEAARGLIAHPYQAMRAVRAALRYSAASSRGLFVHLAYLAEALVIANWCRRDGVEHIHVHFGTNPATVGALVHDLTGIPFSFTVHGPEEFDYTREHGLRAKIAASSFVAAVSSFGRSQLMRWAAPEDWRKIHVVHCGLDHIYLRQPPARVRSRSLLCVARLSEQKGHLLLLEAAAMLRSRGIDFQLRLAGDGPLRSAIENRVRELSLTERVHLLGSLPQSAIREEILKSQALVLPSFAEGLPVVLMESMALGAPVISTYVAGIPELVQPDSGWLVPAGDAEALCVAMKAALDMDHVAMADMGGKARARVLARHNVATSALLLEQHMARGAKAGRAHYAPDAKPGLSSREALHEAAE